MTQIKDKDKKWKEKITSIKCEKCKKEKWKQVDDIAYPYGKRLPVMRSKGTIPKYIPQYCIYCNDGVERWLKLTVRWEMEMMVHKRFIDVPLESWE